MKILLILILLTSLAFSQTVYEIPFASKGNEIELSVHNDSEINLSNVKVALIEKPNWIKFEKEETEITSLYSSSEGIASFKFDLDEQSEVMEEQTLKFQVNGNNQTWEKEIKITILPPEKFELNQNYPNPFNPSTVISYQIPVAVDALSPVEVHLKIYDILGREVETLVNTEQKPGYYKVEWNASNYSSGMYIYQVSIKGANSKREVIRKKMLLMK